MECVVPLVHPASFNSSYKSEIHSLSVKSSIFLIQVSSLSCFPNFHLLFVTVLFPLKLTVVLFFHLFVLINQPITLLLSFLVPTSKSPYCFHLLFQLAYQSAAFIPCTNKPITLLLSSLVPTSLSAFCFHPLHWLANQSFVLILLVIKQSLVSMDTFCQQHYKHVFTYICVR